MIQAIAFDGEQVNLGSPARDEQDQRKSRRDDIS